MQASSKPSKIQTPWANSGTKNTIPVASQIGVTPGAASFTDGFPPLTMTPLASGGVPPSGADFNGVLNAVTAIQQWQSSGGGFTYDSTFATVVGGYPKGAVLVNAANDGYWLNLADNNSTNPDATDGTAANWYPIDGTGIAAVSGLTNANVTLTPDKYGKPIITLAGTLTGNVQIVFPTLAGVEWLVFNNTTGAFTATAKTASGTGLAIPQGGSMFIYCDGTNISQPGQYGTTPAQFDNSQKLITSAFLRSAGLQSSGLNIVSATGNIPVSYVGGDVLFSSASAITGTLPAASSVPSGGRITFTNFNNGVATVARAGTDNIFLNTGPSTTVALGVGDSLTLESSGSTAWYAVGGSAQLGSSAAFGSSFGTTNYQKLPSGMIMQWGQSTCTNTADTTITLPIAFPSVFNSVVATFAHNAGATASALIEAAPSGLTGFIARNNAGSSGFYWIAFGK